MTRKPKFTFGAALPMQRPFKKGDKVTITIREETRDDPSCNSEMVKIAKQKKVQIVDVVAKHVHLEVGYWWHPDWLQHAEEYGCL